MNTRSLMKPSFWNLVFIVLSIHIGLCAGAGCDDNACINSRGCRIGGLPGVCTREGGSCFCKPQKLEGQSYNFQVESTRDFWESYNWFPQ